MANIFNSISLKKPNRTTFDKSYKEKYSTNLGLIYPIFFEEVVPGSHVKLSSSHFVRFQPMLAPIFDSVHYKQYYFFVPYRLLVNGDDKSNTWDTFRTGGVDQIFSDIDDFDTIPYIDGVDWDKGLDVSESRKFLNSFELPFSLVDDILNNSVQKRYNGLSIFAYWKIIQDYFVDEQLDADFIEVWNNLYLSSSSMGLSDLYSIDAQFLKFFRKRYKKDYFTSASLNPQLGNPINLPLNTGISLSTDDNFTFLTAANFSTIGGSPNTIEDLGIDASSRIVQKRGSDDWLLTTLQGYVFDSIRGINSPLELQDLLERVNIENNTLFSVRDLRNSFIMQEMLERNNVAGYRYFEWIKAHFGIDSPDARLQRSEFLGSTDDVINFVEVENNSAGNYDDTPLGYLAGKGIGGGANYIFNKTFQEDGIIIGLACYVPDNNYYQGVPKRFLRITGLDYLLPLFERVGEQAITNEEVCYTGTSRDVETFGYNSRYADYKSHINIEKGDFVDSLRFWTLSRDLEGFGLSAEFLQINYEDFADVFAVQDDSDKILCVQNFNLIHTLPLSRYSTPAKI